MLGEGDGLDGAVLGEEFVFDEVSEKLGMSAQHGARTGGSAFNGCASVGACGESGGYRSGPRGYVKRGTGEGGCGESSGYMKRGTGEGGKGGWGTTGSSAAGLKTSRSLPAIPVKSFVLTGSRAHPHAALVMTGKHKHAGAQPEIAGAQPEMSPLPLHSPQGSAGLPNTARSPSTALVVTLSEESMVTSAAVEEPNVPARIRRTGAQHGAGAQHGVRFSAQYGASSSGPPSLGRGGGEGAGAGGMAGVGGGMVGVGEGMARVGGGMAGKHSAVARMRSSGCPDVRDDDLNPARLACKCSPRRGAFPSPQVRDDDLNPAEARRRAREQRNALRARARELVPEIGSVLDLADGEAAAAAAAAAVAVVAVARAARAAKVAVLVPTGAIQISSSGAVVGGAPTSTAIATTTAATAAAAAAASRNRQWRWRRRRSGRRSVECGHP